MSEIVAWASAAIGIGVGVWMATFASKQTKKMQALLISQDREKENYRQITKESNDALFVIDISNGKILECNNRAAEILGYEEPALKQLTLFDIHPKEKYHESAETIADTWEQKGKVYEHLPYVTKTGSLVPMESSAKVMPYDGRPAITIYARDIRERLRLQAEILEQSHIIEDKNKNLTDSIVYARRIQQAILPSQDAVREAFPNSFLLYRPKDIVSGDFYWTAVAEGKHFLAIADCTGHGVPGAFMSMLGTTILNELVNQRHILKPSLILEQLHIEIRRALKQDQKASATNDGMDIALVMFDTTTGLLEFAGAYRPLIYGRRDSATGTYVLEEVKANRQSIGGMQSEEARTFSPHVLSPQPGDIVYLFTDGYPDQFGGERGRKFMTKHFTKLLEKLADQPIDAQHKTLETKFMEWKGSYEQMDDVLVAGIRF